SMPIRSRRMHADAQGVSERVRLLCSCHLPLVLMRFAARSLMKILPVTLVSLALLAAPAAAETQYQSTMSGNVKIEVTPQDARGEEGRKRGDSLTIHFVEPPKKPPEVDDDPAEKLRQCGEKWNKKLAAYEKSLPKLRKYIAYYDKWESYPAQRPPK